MMKIQKIKFLHLLILGITFLILYSYIYDDKLDLGGDNANYLTLGRAISEGEGLVNIHHANRPPHHHFPPGYPILIGAALKISPFTDQIMFIKKTNGLFLLASCILLYLIIIRLTKNEWLSFAISMLFLFNANLLKFSTIIMSEIPFMLFSLIAILLLISTNFESKVFKNHNFLLLIVVVGFAYHIRSLGIAIIPAVGVHLLYIRKWKYLITWTFGILLTILPWQIRNYNIGSSNGYVKQFLQKNPYRIEEGKLGIADWKNRVKNNSIRYISKEIPTGLFPTENVDYKEETKMEEILFGSFILLLTAVGLLCLDRFRQFFIFYFLSTLAILINWPDIWTGTRFLFQIIPFMLLFVFMGIRKIADYLPHRFGPTLKFKYLPLIACVIIIFFQWPMVHFLNASARGFYPENFQQYIQLAQWVQKSLPKDIVISSRKPTFFHLYSNTLVSSYKHTLNSQELIDHLIENQVTHVVVDRLGYSSTQRYLVPAIQKFPFKFKEVVRIGTEQSGTYLLEFRPNLGYFGEFDSNNLRSGYGEFIWQDGQVYEGSWRNGVRNGYGQLKLPNGNKIVGDWQNDQLTNMGDLLTSTDEFIGKVKMENNQLFLVN